MTALDVSVSQYSLTVDTCDTLNAMIENARNQWGPRLQDALLLAMRATAAYAIPPYVNVSEQDFRPDVAVRPDMPDVEDVEISAVLGKLEAAGYVETRHVLNEDSSGTYLSEGRYVTAVRVLRPFAIAAVRYWFTREANSRIFRDGYGTADRWRLTDRSYIVPAGWYLIGEVGDYKTELYGVAGMGDLPDDDLCWLFDIEGFDASRCFAGCDACGSRWAADSGSWRFEPDCCEARPWAFDDATDFDAEFNTIACPACDLGRVGFDIY